MTTQFVPARRAYARQRVLQALYQWQMTGMDIGLIERQFMEEQPMDRVDVGYFSTLLHAIPQRIAELDEVLRPCLDRGTADLDPIEHAILRIGCYELRYRQDIPWRVVINEAVELAKKYGAEQSHKYVNGVLDKLAQGLEEEGTSS